MMNQLKGKISISRYTSNHRPDVISIRLEDELSGTRFVEIELTPEILGLALTGLAFLDCKFEVSDLDRIGKIREMKTEIIWIDPPKQNTLHQQLRDSAENYVFDGWSPIINKNSRYEPIEKHDNGWSYQISFVRWIEAIP